MVGEDQVTGIEVDSGANLYVSGWFKDTGVMEANCSVLTSAGGLDIYQFLVGNGGNYSEVTPSPTRRPTGKYA